MLIQRLCCYDSSLLQTLVTEGTEWYTSYVLLMS